jgi:regulator of nonsense transcripts 1
MSTKITLLWGPPGTGKTRTVVEILQQLLKAAPTKRIMVAAPTHNAVDNVLRKFVELGGIFKTNTNPIRVSTDVCTRPILLIMITDRVESRYGKSQKT